MKTSVYIPAEQHNVKNLDRIIEIYNNSDVKPDEIIIHVLDVSDKHILDMLLSIQNKKHPNVLMYGRKVIVDIAENLNYCKKMCKGDIILYHDADKFPSTKRVEVVKKEFEVNDIVGLHHSYFNYDVLSMDGVDTSRAKSVNSNELLSRYLPFNDISNIWQYNRNYGSEFSIRYVDMKSMCIKREVLDKISWKEPHEIQHYNGHDKGLYYDFCVDTLYTYRKLKIVDIPLTIVG
jgi:hypothetical protein